MHSAVLLCTTGAGPFFRVPRVCPCHVPQPRRLASRVLGSPPLTQSCQSCPRLGFPKPFRHLARQPQFWGSATVLIGVTTIKDISRGKAGEWIFRMCDVSPEKDFQGELQSSGLSAALAQAEFCREPPEGRQRRFSPVGAPPLCAPHRAAVGTVFWPWSPLAP